MGCWLKLSLPGLMIPVEWNKNNAENIILGLETKNQSNFF